MSVAMRVIMATVQIFSVAPQSHHIVIRHFQEGVLDLHHAYEQLIEFYVVFRINRVPRRRGKNVLRDRAHTLWAQWNDPANNSYWFNSTRPNGKLEEFRVNVRMERKTFDYILRSVKQLPPMSLTTSDPSNSAKSDVTSKVHIAIGSKC